MGVLKSLYIEPPQEVWLGSFDIQVGYRRGVYVLVRIRKVRGRAAYRLHFERADNPEDYISIECPDVSLEHPATRAAHPLKNYTEDLFAPFCHPDTKVQVW